MPNRSVKLTKAELSLIALLLEPLENDQDPLPEYLKLPATQENKHILLNMIEANGDADDRQNEIQDIYNAKDELEVQVVWLCHYLSNKCCKLSRK